MTYSIAFQHVVSRPLAAVRESMSIHDVPYRFGPLLDQEYPAHGAVVAWCQAEGQVLAGISWEVYRHWNDNPSKRRTDRFALHSEVV